jgi:hypothetical protein
MAGRLKLFRTFLEQPLAGESSEDGVIRVGSAFIGVHLRLNLDWN